MMDRGGGQVVSELTLHSDDPSSKPAKAYSFSVKFVFEKNKNQQKEAGVCPFPQKLHLNIELKATFQLNFINLSKKVGFFCIQPNIFLSYGTT